MRVCMGSVSLNPYLASASACSFCIRGGRQAVYQSCFMGFFFGPHRLPCFSLPGLGIHSLEVFLFPASGDDAQRLSRAPHLCYLVFGIPGNRIPPGSGWLGQQAPLLLASSVKFFSKLRGWGPCLYFPSGCSSYHNIGISIGIFLIRCSCQIKLGEVSYETFGEGKRNLYWIRLRDLIRCWQYVMT